jgi:hypothetical protein
MKAVFSPQPCNTAPHLAETTSPTGSVDFAKLSKRELDKSCSSLLPCGAKPSALACYKTRCNDTCNNQFCFIAYCQAINKMIFY